MTETTKQFKKQLPRNSFFQGLSFLTHVGVGLWLVPYLIKHLGSAAYGLIPIAGMLTEYVSLIAQSISSAVNRFLTIALQQNDDKEANRVFSTAFFSYLVIGLLQIPFFILLIDYADSIITIPTDLYQDALILLACSATAFIVNLVASVFGVPMYALNRLDLSRSIDVGRYLLRVAGIVFFFATFAPALRYVGYVDLAISLFLCAVKIVIAYRLAPRLKLSVHYYDWHKARDLMGMGGWLLITNVGVLLFLRMDVWVCNRFVGPESAGEYAAILQWSNLIRHGGTIISTVVAPMIMIHYARSEMEQLLRLSKISVRVLSLAITVPIAAICVFSPSLLRLWLGEAFVSLAPIMVIMLCHLAINVGVMPLFSIQIAMNKVKTPALVNLFMGAINLIIAILFATFFGWGMYGVAIAGAIILTAKNAIFTPLYTSMILKEPWHLFVKPYLSALGLLVGLMMIGYPINQYMAPTSWVQLLLLLGGLGTIGLGTAILILPKSDRLLIASLIPGRLGTMLAKLV